MSFMQIQITPKGALYSADCSKCGATMFTHEWAHIDHNERRDAMQRGECPCDECGAGNDVHTFASLGRQYAARYSAPGYLDATDWHYGRNSRALLREVRAMYGDE